MRNFTIAKRIIFLLAFILLFTLALGAVYAHYMNQVEEQSLSEAQDVMLAGYERTLQYSVETLATGLGAVVAEAKQAGTDPVEAIREAIKPVRYGKKGYYFVYNTKGVNMAHPLRPDFHGQHRIDHKDKKGNPYIKKLGDKAKEGGGFVTYWFNKPGEKEPSPKLAFAKLIPDTDLWVATGIYIDDIEAGRARIKDKLTAILNSAFKVVGTGFGVAFILLVLPLSVSIVRSILAPLRAATSKAQEVAQGQLDIEVEAKGNDEITRLEDALNQMIHTLTNNINEIETKGKLAEEQARVASEAAQEADKARNMAENAKQEGMRDAAHRLETVVDNVSSASEQISAQTSEISIGAETQSKRISETATAMEQMNATVLEVAKNSSYAAEMGVRAKEKAQQGAEIVRQSVMAMNTTQNQTQTLKTNMDQLGRQADSIGAIMTVIEDIADQTNLLALNAAIEAARAGEAGRGFAVVADEVRKLAEKTMGATKEVGDSIKAIQDVASQNIRSVEAAVSDLEQAVELSNQSGEMLSEIVSGVEESSDQIQQIATAAEEQSATSEEINKTIEEVNTIVKETAQGSSQTALAVQDLTEQMEELRKLILDFKSN